MKRAPAHEADEVRRGEGEPGQVLEDRAGLRQAGQPEPSATVGPRRAGGRPSGRAPAGGAPKPSSLCAPGGPTPQDESRSANTVSPIRAALTLVMKASWKWPGSTCDARTAARKNGVRGVPCPRINTLARPHAQGIHEPVVYPHWCGRWITKNPRCRPREPRHAPTQRRDPEPLCRPERPECRPERMKHQACGVSDFGRQEPVEEDVRWVKDPHLAFRDAREPVSPQVVPERSRPARSTAVRTAIRPIENCVTSPPTGIVPPTPIGQSQTAMRSPGRARPRRFVGTADRSSIRSRNPHVVCGVRSHDLPHATARKAL